MSSVSISCKCLSNAPISLHFFWTCLGPSYWLSSRSLPTSSQASLLRAFLHVTREHVLNHETRPCHPAAPNDQGLSKSSGTVSKFLHSLFVIAFKKISLSKIIQRTWSESYWVFGICQDPLLQTCTEYFLKNHYYWIHVCLKWINFSHCLSWSRWELTLIFQSGNLNLSLILGNSNVAFLFFLFSSSVNPFGYMLMVSLYSLHMWTSCWCCSSL